MLTKALLVFAGMVILVGGCTLLLAERMVFGKHVFNYHSEVASNISAVANRIFFTHLYGRPTDYLTGGYCLPDHVPAVFSSEDTLREAHNRYRRITGKDTVRLCRPVRVLILREGLQITVPSLVNGQAVALALEQAAISPHFLRRFAIPALHNENFGQGRDTTNVLRGLDEPREPEREKLTRSLRGLGTLRNIREDSESTVLLFSFPTPSRKEVRQPVDLTPNF